MIGIFKLQKKEDVLKQENEQLRMEVERLKKRVDKSQALINCTNKYWKKQMWNLKNGSNIGTGSVTH